MRWWQKTQFLTSVHFAPSSLVLTQLCPSEHFHMLSLRCLCKLVFLYDHENKSWKSIAHGQLSTIHKIFRNHLLEVKDNLPLNLIHI